MDHWHLRHRLLTLAHDADLVLDLHADNEAEPHVCRPGTGRRPGTSPSAIDARAVLLLRCRAVLPSMRPAQVPRALAATYPDAPIPSACLAATLEMGSNDDVNPERAKEQATALLRDVAGTRLRRRVGRAPAVVLPRHGATAMAQVRSPVAG